MRYEWDEKKRRANLRKHKLDFRDAHHVLEDPCILEFIDTREDYGEERIIAIGLLKEIIVTVVVYTERGNITRIISLRKATTKEQELYYEEN
jgi:uncharacterized DUF497 family protein